MLAKPLYSGIRFILSGPSEQEKVNWRRRDTRNIKISIRARDSPTQALFPVKEHYYNKSILKEGSVRKRALIFSEHYCTYGWLI